MGEDVVTYTDDVYRFTILVDVAARGGPGDAKIQMLQFMREHFANELPENIRSVTSFNEATPVTESIDVVAVTQQLDQLRAMQSTMDAASENTELADYETGSG